MFKNVLVSLCLFIIIALGSLAAMANPPAPNLSVLTWQGQANPLVESPYQYTSRVQNIGNQTANGVVMTIEFPLTNTSPAKFILGKLTGIQTSQGTCSVVGNKIVCNFGSIGNNQTRQVSFTFEFQVATTAPTMRSSVTTTSTNEQNVGNNSLSVTPTLRYPDNIVTGGPYMVTSCTGRGLTSFYECEMSPGSTQSFNLELNPGGTLSVPQASSYFGLWDQTGQPANKQLHFTINSGNSNEVNFNGFAISGSCFEGITTFPGSSGVYNAAYKVCEQ